MKACLSYLHQSVFVLTYSTVGTAHTSVPSAHSSVDSVHISVDGAHGSLSLEGVGLGHTYREFMIASLGNEAPKPSLSPMGMHFFLFTYEGDASLYFESACENKV